MSQSRRIRPETWPGSIQGVFGYVFDVDKSTWGKGFRVEPVTAAFQADLDMSFYTELGKPYPATAPETVVYETRLPGGEAGEVPEKMTKAIVCMYTGHDVEFKYTRVPASRSLRGTRRLSFGMEYARSAVCISLEAADRRNTAVRLARSRGG